jgi:thioester reductase-like protein
MAAGFGYGESKWVTENICQRISESTGLISSIVRVGQLCGDTDGRWNVKEWVPALIKAGKAIGSLPSRNEVNSLGDSWFNLRSLTYFSHSVNNLASRRRRRNCHP